MKRHLLESADLDRADATLVLDTAAQIDQALAGREVKKLPTTKSPTATFLTSAPISVTTPTYSCPIG